MIYKGYFLYYDDNYGWGYLILDKYKVVFDRKKLVMVEEGMFKFLIA